MHVKSACTIPSVGGLSLPKSSPLMLTRLGGGCSQPASTVTAAFPSQQQTSQHQGHALQRDVLQPACALAYPATVSSWSQTAPQYDIHLIESDLGWRTVPLQANYSRGRVLGHGSFGAVTSATHLASGTPCAIKTMPKIRGKLTKEKTLEKLQREVDLLQRLQVSSKQLTVGARERGHMLAGRLFSSLQTHQLAYQETDACL